MWLAQQKRNKKENSIEMKQIWYHIVHHKTSFTKTLIVQYCYWDSVTSEEPVEFTEVSTTIGRISVFFFCFRITCLGITSRRKFPPFHTVADTLSSWNVTCSSYDRNIGTVSAVVATVNIAWSRMNINIRFWSPSNPLNRHHMLFAFCAFFDSSLSHHTNSISMSHLCLNSYGGVWFGEWEL